MTSGEFRTTMARRLHMTSPTFVGWSMDGIQFRVFRSPWFSRKFSIGDHRAQPPFDPQTPCQLLLESAGPGCPVTKDLTRSSEKGAPRTCRTCRSKRASGTAVGEISTHQM
jgi:hypothetical protein